MQKACEQLVRNLTDAAKDVRAETASAFWEATVAKVHPGVGFAPATAPLSAIGFFDGSETGGTSLRAYEMFHRRDKPCHESKNPEGIFERPLQALSSLKQEVDPLLHMEASAHLLKRKTIILGCTELRYKKLNRVHPLES